MKAPLLLTALACGACATTSGSRQAEVPPEPEKLIASGRALTGGTQGVRPFAGTPVQVELTFKDATPACIMQGQVQFARDQFHRWVWLEPTPGCPEWMTGRWWAELIAGNGWVVANISSKPVGEAKR